MPSSGEIREWRTLRGRFLSALWDAQRAGNRYPEVADILDGLETGRPDNEIGCLVEGLVDASSTAR